MKFAVVLGSRRFFVVLFSDFSEEQLQKQDKGVGFRIE